MYHLLGVLCLLVTVSALGLPKLSKLAEPTVAKLMQLTNCDLDKEYALSYRDVAVDRIAPNRYSASGDFSVIRQVDGPINVNVEVKKCRDKFDTDTCELYTKWEGDGCMQLKTKQGSLYNLFKSVGVKDTSCPLKPNDYELRDWELDIPAAAAAAAHAVGSYWWARTTVTGGDDEYLCADVWIELDKS